VDNFVEKKRRKPRGPHPACSRCYHDCTRGQKKTNGIKHFAAVQKKRPATALRARLRHRSRLHVNKSVVKGTQVPQWERV